MAELIELRLSIFEGIFRVKRRKKRLKEIFAGDFCVLMPVTARILSKIDRLLDS
ncbi:hypothetical protein [Neobacillus niacini]|uniref:hypothetical protein n=1 Tax=Neobacillus niacini TaxID=86668 RepID=UPI00286C5696|nr:hypothetical protein [Neobacillus niacini]